LRSLVDERELFARSFERGCGRIESFVARHWPELSMHIEQSSAWHLHLLSHFPSPQNVAKSTQAVQMLLQRVSNQRLPAERIEQVIRAASGSVGLPTTERDEECIRTLTGYLLELRTRVKEIDRRIRAAVATQASLSGLAEAFGATTTAVIFADVGNPAEFQSSRAFQKALGLNLKESSSGTRQGRLRITKRGPGRARRYLFLAALRCIARYPLARAWYQARTAFQGGLKIKAVVALMRKLARAMIHVARGQSLDVSRLFDARCFASDLASVSRESSSRDSDSLLVFA
jgi:hypothetical protein